MYNKLLDKKAKLALIGLGYVGLPIALEFAKKISVIGFDINEERLAKMRKKIDPCNELGTEAFILPLLWLNYGKRRFLSWRCRPRSINLINRI